MIEAIDGDLFERVPWLVAKIVQRQPCQDLAAFVLDLIAEATPDEQMTLLRAHPALGSPADRPVVLTSSSRKEQSSAGLDLITPEQATTMRCLNRKYLERFDFPFIMAIRDSTVDEILDEMQKRLGNATYDERETALAEVQKIMRLRLAGACR